MAARGVAATVVDGRVAEVDRIVESSALHGSESLCRLLRYLTNRAIQDPGTTIREHEIATEVFARCAFDPRIDSTVRVNIARLRGKLIEYYNGPGAEDPIVVELPRGSYSVVFQDRPRPVPVPSPTPAPPESVDVEFPVSEIQAVPLPRMNRLLAAGLIAMTAIAALLAATLLVEQTSRTRIAAAAPQTNGTSLNRFWGMLLDGQSDPWVVFSNASFVGQPATGMRYLVPSRDTGREVVDFYTGIGEVLGVHMLDQTFGLLHRQFRVKRGALLSLDDVENNDIVYIGSPLENLTLREVPNLRDFEFKLIEDGPQKGAGSLVNRAPQPGEPHVFVPSSLPLTKDYAVVALVPGLDPSRWALILAGTSTIGTQGAVEYVCREDTVHELLSRFSAVPPASRPVFEAVLDVEIKGGVPVHSTIVALHRRTVQ
jgi:hypothetical protein